MIPHLPERKTPAALDPNSKLVTVRKNAAFSLSQRPRTQVKLTEQCRLLGQRLGLGEFEQTPRAFCVVRTRESQVHECAYMAT